MNKKIITVLVVLCVLLLLLFLASAYGIIEHECCINCPICLLAKNIKDLLSFALLLAVAVSCAETMYSCRIGYSKESDIVQRSSTPVKLKVKLSD
ncbi:MAG: hypothetical protein IJW49_05595 [Clostridia bacterium]|nr:hypothetical protein [Clostridia bacterium]